MILGGGFTGSAVGRLVCQLGGRAVATTRSGQRAEELEAGGVRPLVLSALSAQALAPHVSDETRVVVTFPPDGATDRAIAPAIARARSVVYVSSTGVYGGARGHVNEDTPVDATAPRARARLEAEQVWRDLGGIVVRAPAIYGPGRGMHRRLLSGDLRIAGDGSNAISRVHVDDLATALWAALQAPQRGALYVIGDDAPVPQIEVIRWLAERLGVPLPPSAPLVSLDETLRHDRRVDNARIRRALALELRYPTYREGFSHCLEREGIVAR